MAISPDAEPASGATCLIVIPARFGSTRLPGKPLVEIAGRALLDRVVDAGRRAAELAGGASLVVATDDARIADHAARLGCAVAMTDGGITSGSGRALAAALAHRERPDIVVNLQGDAPFVPARVPAMLIAALRRSDADMATPVVRLSWDALDALRDHKRRTPSSGTTCIRAADGRALWFSKAIIPAIRDEAARRRESDMSPVYQHLGVYAYRLAALEAFERTAPTPYERIEQLEQLRCLETGMTILTVETPPPPHALSGIDTPEDVTLAEASIRRHGDPFGG